MLLLATLYLESEIVEFSRTYNDKKSLAILTLTGF